ncbi:phage tail protein [Pseudomonas gingeri]|uniref:phage tail protein n=1 Tax=Pseudomonas gingeri TaxID=117681 RepID=UPI0015A0E4C8|nr:phage tail protein [Pseudomonas gingeri]NWA11913.1 tail fiber protein [Pseudomonas gingeri]
MANPIIINPTLTLAGQAAAFSKYELGLELVITHLTFGDAHYNPTGEEVALRNQLSDKIPVSGGGRPTPYQLRLNCVWNTDVGMHPVGEIGYWSDDVLVFVWSRADGGLAGYKTDGVPYVLFNDLAFGQVPSGSINLVVDPTASVALAALAEHETSHNAHPQYLLRSDVAQDSGQLAWLGLAGGTANALVLNLQAPETELVSLEPGQRFQFLAADTNTTAVTANIEGIGNVPVMRGGDDGLVDLDPGDIKAHSIYDLNYDGTRFQLGGGVGSGKTFERFSFTASVAQSVFTFPHSPGSLIALRNGREFYDFTSAPDGSKVTTTPMNINDRLDFLAFKSFKVANTYTKAELTALMATAGAMPVGAMLPFPVGIVPAGYLEVNGDVFSDAIYPDLAAYIAKKFNQAGDAAGYSRLPDSRGEFFRGWDHGRGIDAGRALGAGQLDAMQGHYHDLAPGNTQLIGNGTAGIGSQLTQAGSGNQGYTKVGPPGSDGTNGIPRTASETRPRNLAVMWCIKAWNAPVNQGNVDVAALVAELAALRSSTPVGAIVAFPKADVPAGYLEMDGSVQLIAVYPDLAAYLGTSFNTGGEPAGTFRLPDGRGEFLRGWDHGRGVDAGRAMSSWQDSQNRAHTHKYGKLHSTNYGLSATGIKGLEPTDQVQYETASSGGEESRPRNLAVMWCLKAWNAPINQGNIDIAAIVPLATQATEIKQGTAKVATDAQMLDSANDAVMATPKKLRKGFAISLAANGYITFPTWLGGLIFQWGTAGAIGGNASLSIPFTLAFPNAVLNVSPSRKSANVDSVRYPVAWTATPTNLLIWADDNGVDNISYLAIGY